MNVPSQATVTVKNFLEAMEKRDLAMAASFMAAEAAIVYPGGQRYNSQQEMVEAAAKRYHSVRKTIERIDEIRLADESAIVYVVGTLSGESKQGYRFKGVRFVDRFEIRDNLIVGQQVWNDLAESGVLDRAP